jgi:hypothetical protein
MRWICIGLGVPGFVFAYRASVGNLFASLSLALTPITLLIAVERALQVAKEQKSSGLTDQQLMLQKAGSAKNLRYQSSLVRVCGYAFAIIAMPMLVIGVIASMRGSTTAFFIALAAAFLLYGAKVFLDVASKMRAAAKEPPQ